MNTNIEFYGYNFLLSCFWWCRSEIRLHLATRKKERKKEKEGKKGKKWRKEWKERKKKERWLWCWRILFAKYPIARTRTLPRLTTLHRSMQHVSELKDTKFALSFSPLCWTAWQHLYLTSNLAHEDVPSRFRKHATEVFKFPPTQDHNIHHTKHECNWSLIFFFSRLSSHKLQACCGSNPIFAQHNVTCLWDTFYCRYWHLAVNLSSRTQEQYAHLMEYHGLTRRLFSRPHFQLTSHFVCD